MERKTIYRVLLVAVIILAVIFTLGVVGVVPFVWSERITAFMIVLFFALRFTKNQNGS